MTDANRCLRAVAYLGNADRHFLSPACNKFCHAGWSSGSPGYVHGHSALSRASSRHLGAKGG
jgi:hypothetical protein